MGLLVAGTPGSGCRPGWAQDPPEAARPEVPVVARGELGRTLDSFVSRFVPFGFAGQVLAVVDGRVVLHRAYGMADRAARRPMTTETAVGLASASKQFTAAAALKLSQEGRLALDDPIERWLEDVPEDKRGITIQQLLTHTACLQVGLTEDFEAASRQEQVAAILDAPLTGEPGGAWRYANGGYILAAAIVREVAGMSYEAYLRQALFEPAGMNHTGFLHEPPEGAPVARAYSGWEDRGAPGEWPENWRALGAGDLVSTAADLWRWEQALRAGTILSNQWLERYLTAQVEIGETAGYAYGLFVHQGENGRVIEHGGDTRVGFNVGFFRYPDRDAILIVTSNSQLSPGRWMRHTLSADLERLLLGEEVKFRPPSARLPTREETKRLTGTFRLGSGNLLHLIHDGTYLWMAAEGQGATDLLYGREAEEHAISEAIRKTRMLLAGLHGETPRHPDAYPRALTRDGLSHLDDYAGEWGRLEAALGPFERFEVLGAIPFRDDVVTTGRLRFRDGEVTMTYFWSERGHGRLHSTQTDAGAGFPVHIPTAVGSEGDLVVHDPWRETTLRARLTDDGASLRLEFEDGPEAVRRGLVAWTPQGR